MVAKRCGGKNAPHEEFCVSFPLTPCRVSYDLIFLTLCFVYRTVSFILYHIVCISFKNLRTASSRSTATFWSAWTCLQHLLLSWCHGCLWGVHMDPFEDETETVLVWSLPPPALSTEPMLGSDSWTASQYFQDWSRRAYECALQHPEFNDWVVLGGTLFLGFLGQGSTNTGLSLLAYTSGVTSM